MKAIILILGWHLFLANLWAEQKPNIVIILNGVAGAHSFACYGSENKTPNIDAAAAKGVHFRFAWATVDGQRCNEIIQSGRYENGGGLQPPLLTELLTGAGYKILKWDQLKGKTPPRPFFVYLELNDASIKELDAAVAELAGLEDTFLFISSKQGLSQGQNPNATASVPLVVSGPGITNPGRESWDLVDFTDFFPTVAALAGIDLEAPVHGKSFLPSLQDSDDPFKKRNWIYTRSGENWMIRDWANVLTSDQKFLKVSADHISTEEIRKNDKIAPHRKERLEMLVDRLHETLKGDAVLE